MNGILQSLNTSDIKKTKRHIWSRLVCLILLSLSFICFFSSLWYIKVYGNTSLDSLLFTIFSNMQGAEAGLMKSFALKALLPALALTICITYFFFFAPDKLRKFYTAKHKYIVIASVILAVILLVVSGIRVGFADRIKDITQQSGIFEEKYISPDSVDIKFPEKKRNLIYIFLESMETTYLSQEQGGALEYSLTPELCRLAEENINFSHNDGVGGFSAINGATWTVAAITAQTSGIPLKAPSMFQRNAYGRENFLPGVKSITNILKDNGYYQALMFGSDDVFANRDVYYRNHGIDKIYDLDTAREDGLIPQDYYVWWGMEDMYLFKYAKDKLSEISAQNTPFAFTMLTVDTHHVAGYKCELCEDIYEEQYDNVITCSDRQVTEFINWLSEQSFFEDTTIIICGDHLTMDADYIKRNVAEGYDQHIYNCIINSAIPAKNTKNRSFSSVDMFPTTLAALGCEIEGNRLGLGSNLFSDTPTLIEEMGFDEFNYQLSLNSNYYTMNFVINH